MGAFNRNRSVLAPVFGVLGSLVLGVPWSRPSSAQQPPAEEADAPIPSVLAPALQLGSEEWVGPPARYFLAAAVDTGFLYLRPRLSAGYGLPHRSWLGVDVNPTFSSEGVNLRIGGRAHRTFDRTFLLPRRTYDVEAIERQEGPSSRYLTWEAELTTGVTLGTGRFITELAVSRVTGVAKGYFVYEETLRAVVDPPWVLRGRASYLLALDEHETIRFGPVVELLSVPKRDVLVYRGGAAGTVRLSPALQARGSFVPALAARDQLGVRGGSALLLGVRYLWATGP